MIHGGTATIYVSSMERAAGFYRDVLGLRMLAQNGGESTTFDAGAGLILDLRRTSPVIPPPGTSGSISVGLRVTRSIDDVVQELIERGVSFRGPVHGGPGDSERVAYFNDPDGNDLYLCELRR